MLPTCPGVIHAEKGRRLRWLCYLQTGFENHCSGHQNATLGSHGKGGIVYKATEIKYSEQGMAEVLR